MNAAFSIVVTDDGIRKGFMLVQFANASCRIVRRLELRLTLVKAEQLAKIQAGSSVTPDPMLTDLKFPLWSKQYSPRDVTEFGTVTEVKPVREKAEYPIFVTLLGMVIFVKFEQSAKV